MKRNTITTLDQLQVGDRFYKLADTAKAKSMYQIMDTDQQIRTIKQKHFACPVPFVGSKSEPSKTTPIMGNIQVVFLRNTGQ